MPIKSYNEITTKPATFNLLSLKICKSIIELFFCLKVVPIYYSHVLYHIYFILGTNIEYSHEEAISKASPFSIEETKRQNSHETEEETPDHDTNSEPYLIDEIKEESDHIVYNESSEADIEKLVENIIVVHEERAADVPESDVQNQYGEFD